MKTKITGAAQTIVSITAGSANMAVYRSARDTACAASAVAPLLYSSEMEGSSIASSASAMAPRNSAMRSTPK